MSELDPEFKQHLEEALLEVATGDIGPITADRELMDLGLDSISIAEMVIELEDKIDVTLEMEDMKELETLGDLQELVRRVMDESAK